MPLFMAGGRLGLVQARSDRHRLGIQMYVICVYGSIFTYVRALRGYELRLFLCDVYVRSYYPVLMGPTIGQFVFVTSCALLLLCKLSFITFA